MRLRDPMLPEPDGALNGAIKVLICDDVDAMRELLRAIVDEQPTLHVVGEARDGNEAVAEAERLKPHVILLDLAMPNRTGLDALPDLKRVAPQASVIVLSGFESSAVLASVRELGAAHYLQKGCDPAEIIATIEQSRNGAKPEGVR
jgi:DNA-binding NarL/FixJ family response regulator